MDEHPEAVENGRVEGSEKIAQIGEGSCQSLTMVIRVNVPEELAELARARGVPVEVYVEELLAQQVASAEAVRLQTPEQIRAWLDALAQFSDKIPPLPETISREWIYQDHE